MVCSVVAVLALATVCPGGEYDLIKRTDLDPNFQYHPSPADWRDVNMYQIFTDRFFDGNSGNNLIRFSTQGQPWYNQHGGNNEDDRHLFQGGDWAGITQKLPYLADMGVNAIWISGVQINEQGLDKRFTPYHGYHPANFYRCEPQFGTFDELRTLIDTAHSMGIYVILDVVINHMADLFQLCNCQCNAEFYCASGCGQGLCWRDQHIQFGAPFNNPAWFHEHGPINNYDNYPEYVLGAFIGTEDLKTEDPAVQAELDNVFKHLIDATDCDGFRVDAIKHVEFNWVKSWADNMRQHAAFRGKSDFLLFGELFSYDNAAQASYCKDNGYSFNSTLWFPMQLTMKEVFAYEDATSKLSGQLNALNQYGEAATRVVAFMDNHDVDRIALECGSQWEAKLGPALTFMYTALPVPCLFYGTEHGFNQGDRRNGPPTLAQADFQRETMFNYGWQWGNAFGDKFVQSTLYNYIATLNDLRDQYISLRRGNLTQRWQEGGKGLFAYTRVHGDEESLVVINTDWGTKSCTPQVTKPDGTTYVNVLNPTETATVSGGTLSVSVDGKGSKIFVAGAAAGTGTASTTCSNDRMRIIYDPTGGPLDGFAGPIWIGIGHDGFQDAGEFEMTPVNGVWEYDYVTTAVVSEVDFVFHDNAATPTYDDNNGDDWAVSVDGCSDPIELQWIGNTQHSPVDGEWDVGEDLLVTIESWPRDGAAAGEVVYSPDGGTTWTNVDLVHDGIVGNNDAWTANLGSYGLGVTIRYAVTLSGGTNVLWDNNEGNDYTATVNFGSGAITSISGTHHSPTNGDLSASDDLWVFTSTEPEGMGLDGLIVYSADGGATWQDQVMTLDTNGAAGADGWMVNLGTFPAGSNVQYAVRVRDLEGTDHWDNNGGSDYLAVVSANTSLLEWFGNTHHVGMREPWLDLSFPGGALCIDMMQLKTGATYSVQSSTNLSDWVTLDTMVVTNNVGKYVDEAAFSGDAVTKFYRVTVDAFAANTPVVVGDDLVIAIETYPAGIATGVNLVYSDDGGGTWDASPMMLFGQVGNNDRWERHLGSYPVGTIVQYAVEVIDDEGNSQWDNNGGSDYSVEVLAP